MPIRSLFLPFFGNFQCRLATDPTLTSATVTQPPSPGDFSLGWTFDFGEKALDRVIRLSAPLSLRKDGMIWPWKDTKVTDVKVDRGKGLSSVAKDPMIGQVVSFGAAKFDSAKGAGAGKEALIDFEFSAGAAIKASGVADPRITTSWGHPDQGNWKKEYVTKKPSAASGISPGPRRDHVVLSGVQTMYAHFYSAMGTVADDPLKPPVITAKSGVLAEIKTQMTPKAPGTWKIHIDFYQFDGDTLTGTVNGWLTASF